VTKYRAPFPWFGGKSRVAGAVWDRLGADICNFVEPFFGSGAVLLARPGGPGKNETANDKDCYLANFWRAIHQDPEAVAYWADWPVNEADLHARHRWLVDQVNFCERMKTDPEYFDVKIAGWWVWGISQWIGSGWCSNPEWTGRTNAGRSARGVHRKRVELKRGGKGVHRTHPHISGDAGASGMGVNAGYCSDLVAYFEGIATRLRSVRVCCGDWMRVLGASATTKIGLTAVFLDPPYASERKEVYREESMFLAHEVCEWAIRNGENPQFRIALCGYEGEHKMPLSWTEFRWKANGGYGNQSVSARGRSNAQLERIWFSPHCLKVAD
jgi:DNA adenine methylase